jgi:hypothetical protein
MKSDPPKTVYLVEAELSGICFLDEILYWVAFQRLPIFWSDLEGSDCREGGMAGYEVDCAQYTLEEDECAMVGLSPDPRRSFDWSSDVKLDDDLQTIIAQSAQAAAEKQAQDHSELKNRNEAAKLHQELQNWRPKYRRAMELPMAEIFAALKRGRLSLTGKLLPDLDPEKALHDLAKNGLDVCDIPLEPLIPKEFWSQHEIFWELSAARNEVHHYCQLCCLTEDLMSVFPLQNLRAGEQVSVERFGSFFTRHSAGRQARRMSRRRRVGRPELYPWDRFHLELADLAKRDVLPSKKEAAIEYFQKWFAEETGQSPPSRAAIGAKLTPYYDRFVRNGRQKTTSEITV